MNADDEPEENEEEVSQEDKDLFLDAVENTGEVEKE